MNLKYWVVTGWRTADNGGAETPHKAAPTTAKGRQQSPQNCLYIPNPAGEEQAAQRALSLRLLWLAEEQRQQVRSNDERVSPGALSDGTDDVLL